MDCISGVICYYYIMSSIEESVPNVGHFDSQVEWEGLYYGQRRTDHISTSELLNARAHGVAQKMLPYRYESALRTIEAKLSRVFPDEMLTPGGEVVDLAKNVQGPMVEIGGPTATYDRLFANMATLSKRADQPIVKVNITDSGQETIRADANRLPFANNSLGLIFASCLPKEAKTHHFNEAFRTLGAGGILAYQRGYNLDIYHALSLGFLLKTYNRQPRPREEFLPGLRMWNVILQKPR